MKRAALRRKILSQYDTLGEFAVEMGVSNTGISNIMTGNSNPTYDTIIKYCNTLGIKQTEIGCLFFPEVKE